MTETQHISSRDNPLVKMLRRLSRGNLAYRREGQIWLEGDHLCEAAFKRGLRPEHVVLSESGRGRWSALESHAAGSIVVVPDRLFADFSQFESPAGVGWVLQWPGNGSANWDAPTVVLDRIQDAGNVGSILRSAAAFGFSQVLAMGGTAALWSPKVLRAGMGAHFALNLVEMLEPEALTHLTSPILVTHPHAGESLGVDGLPWPCAWVFGHEGQGVSEALQSLARRTLRIEQPGGQESLNVAACAAICMHATARRRP